MYSYDRRVAAKPIHILKATMRRSQVVEKDYHAPVRVILTPTAKFAQLDPERQEEVLAEIKKLTFKDFHISSDGDVWATGRLGYSGSMSDFVDTTVVEQGDWEAESNVAVHSTTYENHLERP